MTQSKRNQGRGRTLDEILQTAVGRRHVVSGGLGVAVIGFFSSGFVGTFGCEGTEHAKDRPSDQQPDLSLSQSSLLGFTGVAAVFDPSFDQVKVPQGYRWEPFFSWGDPVTNDAPPWLGSAKETAEDQEKQAGQNHDGMHFFPIHGASDHGLLVVNHEYVNPQFLHPNGPTRDPQGRRLIDQVRKEQAAHGVSVIEVKKVAGRWTIVRPSKYARRIHGRTPMTLTGPAAGHGKMKTKDDPTGRLVLGTYNNCSFGYTPWGTYLACEENIQDYFGNRDLQDLAMRREQKRIGIKAESKYGWETIDPRFDGTPQQDQDSQGHVNESNRFGWVVEIDPFNPNSQPKKRTAMGRFVRECATPSMGDDGKMAFYMGDDSRGEYLYKFVPKKRYQPTNREANRDLLDDGTLYVAVFQEDGVGEWRPLVFGENGLTVDQGFLSQADVLINTRSAADVVGATSMDRPEWVAVHPQTREVYVTLTNNTDRGKKQDINPANPRLINAHGHIIRFQEQDRDPTATTFKWEIFLLAGDPQSPQPELRGNIKGDIFSSPDGLKFDDSGRLWIQTDYGDDDDLNQNFGLNQMLAADPISREVRRFFVGPKGCEVTGIAFSPDSTAMFVNVQHPSLSFPAGDGVSRPRSTTVLITKIDGGVIGT